MQTVWVPLYSCEMRGSKRRGSNLDVRRRSLVDRRGEGDGTLAAQQRGVEAPLRRRCRVPVTRRLLAAPDGVGQQRPGASGTRK